MTKFKVTIGNTTVEFPSDEYQQAKHFADIAGVKVEEVDVPESLPEVEDVEVDAWKVKAVLEKRKMTSAILSAIELLPEDDRIEALAAWNGADTFNINSQTVRFVQFRLGLTDNEMLTIFDEAKKTFV